MRIAVAGLWHLGSVTAACLAKGEHDVIGFDSDNETIANLQNGNAPIFEPGLNDLIQHGIAQNKLSFTTDVKQLNTADVLWAAYDTPVDDNDIADVLSVTNAIQNILPYLQKQTLIVISSQLPVGSTRQLIEFAKAHVPHLDLTFAYSPENLRLGKAIQVFTQPDRVVVGLESDADKERVCALLKPFTDNIVWMSIESAEMTKHALNAFLATSVVFINELATLCERVGADAREVERGLKSEERIGPKAYLRPGAAIAGGTLARDVNFLIQIGKDQHSETPFFFALLNSNHAHKQWSCRRMLDVLQDLKGKVITTLGLTYKAGTDTLRRSTAIETCTWLSQQGAKVVAYDPALTELPSYLAEYIELRPSLEEALEAADAVVVSTEWPQFIALTASQLLEKVKQPLVFDASGFLMKGMGSDERIQYFSVGR